MTVQKNVLGLVYTSGKVRRSPLVGMKFLHERAMGAPDLLGARSRLQAKDLISLLWRHFPGTRRHALPRCRIAIRALTPAGFPAVKIRC